jgi:VanZ family protein
MSREQLRSVGRIATVLAVAVILYLTLTPSPPSSGPLPDYLAHFALFGLLGGTSAIWYATSDLARLAPRRTLIALLLVLWIFAAATELGQEFILDRHVDQGDWIANVIGAIGGVFAGSVLARLLLERGER